jgi:hypothetical protein
MCVPLSQWEYSPSSVVQMNPSLISLKTWEYITWKICRIYLEISREIYMKSTIYD